MTMGKSRESALSKSIQSALYIDPNTFRRSETESFKIFFSIHYIRLLRYADLLFKKLRNDVWEINEYEYLECFSTPDTAVSLRPMGDLGLSGSTFLTTPNTKFLVKSLPRHFEHSFFRRDLLQPYFRHMLTHPNSLLVWITDYVFAPYVTLGSVLKTTPSHHVIMENMLCGKNHDPARDQWQTFDLKPVEYFYPQRDLVPDPLLKDGTLERLGGKFEDKMRLSRDDYEDFMITVRDDTAFLESANAVDYSLFMVRFPAGSEPGVVGRGNRWRVGVCSVDGLWKYRAVILDFFWARHTLPAQVMSGVVQTFNMVGRQGPMTITTTAGEYRQKFLEMVQGVVEVYDTQYSGIKEGPTWI